MTVEYIKWAGERIHVHHHLFDPNGIHETLIFYPDEALEILFWLQQQKKELLAAYEKQLRREENVS